MGLEIKSPVRSPTHLGVNVTSKGPARNSESVIVGWLLLVGLAALGLHLLRPILFPFLFAAALSVPLHRIKLQMVAAQLEKSKSPKIHRVALKFVLGPLFTLIEGYASLIERRGSANASETPASNNEHSQPMPWPLWMFKWALRTTLLQLLWSSTTFRGVTVLVVAGLVAAHFASLDQQPQPNEPLPPAKLKELANAKTTSLLVTMLVLIPAVTFVYFMNNLVYAAPDLLYAGVSLLANDPGQSPPTITSPNTFAVIPDMGIRNLALQFAVPTLREQLIPICESQLALTFHKRNTSCVDAARTALGGFQIYNDLSYGSSKVTGAQREQADLFRARYPTAVEFIELAAYGRRLRALLKFGPAVAEVRWLGPDAFLPTNTSPPQLSDRDIATNSSFFSTHTRESLDPTSSLATVLPPLLGDLFFSSLVFFGTLFPLVSSELGVSGHLSRLLGVPLARALTEPWDSACSLTADMLFLRTSLAVLLNGLVFPGTSLGIQSILPFAAVAATIAPLIPAFVLLGFLPAAVLFLAHGAPFAAVLVVYVHFLWSPEGEVVESRLGKDGVGVIDGFATWMGWMAFDWPFGLFIGPWCFLALRRVFTVLCDR